MTAYAAWVAANPWLSAALQFALLGTLGEIVAASLRRRMPALPCSPLQLAASLTARLGGAGTGDQGRFHGDERFYGGAAGARRPAGVVRGRVRARAGAVGADQRLLRAADDGVPPLEDNLILGRRDWTGLTRAWFTLAWFWIPAHTITFSLPRDYQIGLAAVWGLVLASLGWSGGERRR